MCSRHWCTSRWAAIKNPSWWCLSGVNLTALDSWRNWMFACPCLCRGAVEPVVLWRGENDNHPGRLNDSDQHCDHPSLGMEQLHLWWRPQAKVPLIPGAEEHHRLSEVRRPINTLSTSTPTWRASGVTSNVGWPHGGNRHVNFCLPGIFTSGGNHNQYKQKKQCYLFNSV